jgi:hypothetical protein
VAAAVLRAAGAGLAASLFAASRRTSGRGTGLYCFATIAKQSGLGVGDADGNNDGYHYQRRQQNTTVHGRYSLLGKNLVGY